jgi:hypothetical protein
LVSYKGENDEQILVKVTFNRLTNIMELSNSSISFNGLGNCKVGNFDMHHKVFILGGDKSENIEVIDPVNMEYLFTMEGHK